jgi:hypothetical protein
MPQMAFIPNRSPSRPEVMMVLVILSGKDLLAREINFDDCIVESFGEHYRVIDPGSGAVVASSRSYPAIATWLYKGIHG